MAKKLRCAIYTRKSTEEGLEQGFKSLHAQREACEAYILSQAGEGWAALPTIYDDGGFSGGNTERPGLKQLLGDIERQAIDIVVVYKVDRLTRSLSDFARIVEIFDKANVSFVSVTQAFNTTNSMGRLTLNVLLSFAQFEREVTGERIRDKIAASKAKGMWMGGGVPLGYDPPAGRDRSLVVNDAEAATAKLIFERYLALGSVRKLVVDLRHRGITTKTRTARSGRVLGGRPWLEGPLHHFLRNPIYRGLIAHKGKLHPGRHPAIISADLFEAVQARLAAGGPGSDRARRGLVSPLKGRIFDDHGHPMTPSSTRRAGRLHRYYVSMALIRGDRGVPGSLARIPAAPIEALVDQILEEHLDPGKVEGNPRSALQRVTVSADAVEIALDPTRLRSSVEGHGDDAVTLRIPVTVKTFSGAKTLTDPTGAPLRLADADPALRKAIARARAWDRQICNGERSGADDIAATEDLQSRYVDKVLQLASLAPDLVEAILAGKRLRDFTLTELINLDIPIDWRQQRQMLVVV